MEKAMQVLGEILTDCRNYTKETDYIFCKENGKRVLIIPSTVDKLNIQVGKEYIANMLKENCEHLIIIYTCITSSANKMCAELENYTIELFNVDELTFNISKHRLVPRHIKLNTDERDTFVKDFGVKIPAILKTDPIAKLYLYKPGDIIKIIRPNNEISYRICK